MKAKWVNVLIWWTLCGLAEKKMSCAIPFKHFIATLKHNIKQKTLQNGHDTMIKMIIIIIMIIHKLS